MAKDDDSYLKKENKVTVSATIDPDLLKRLEKFVSINNYVRARVIEKAIKELLDREEKKK